VVLPIGAAGPVPRLHNENSRHEQMVNWFIDHLNSKEERN
jgi:hypothetical protein